MPRHSQYAQLRLFVVVWVSRYHQSLRAAHDDSSTCLTGCTRVSFCEYANYPTPQACRALVSRKRFWALHQTTSCQNRLTGSSPNKVPENRPRVSWNPKQIRALALVRLSDLRRSGRNLKGLLLENHWRRCSKGLRNLGQVSVSDLDRDLSGQVPKDDPERVSETLPRTLFGTDFG